MNLISYIEYISFTGKVYLSFRKIYGKNFKVNVANYLIVGTI